MKRDFKQFCFTQEHNSENMVHIEYYHGTMEGQVGVTILLGRRNNSCSSMIEEHCKNRQQAAKLLWRHHNKIHSRQLPW